MTRNGHNHRSKTNPWDREEETHDTDKHRLTHDSKHVRIQRGDRVYIEFLSNTGLDPLKNHKATKPAWWPASSAIWILFSLIKIVRVGPLLAILSGSAHEQDTTKVKQPCSSLLLNEMVEALADIYIYILAPPPSTISHYILQTNMCYFKL